jgi:cation:H+ antiporter
VDFTSFSLGTNLAVFAVASVIVWAAGTRLADYAETIAGRTGLSRAFLGLLLLGVATSLPEIATTVTASAAGNARLATNNLFGGVAMQIAILAVVDLLTGSRPLTYFTPQPVLLLQGVMLVLLLAVAIAGMAAGDPLSLAGVGLVPVLLVAGYLLTVYLSHREEYSPRWQVTNPPEEPAEGQQGGPLPRGRIAPRVAPGALRGTRLLCHSRGGLDVGLGGRGVGWADGPRGQLHGVRPPGGEHLVAGVEHLSGRGAQRCLRNGRR